MSDASGNAVTHTQVITCASSGAARITLNPEDQTVPLGSPATFTVAAEGCGMTYQWLRNGAAIPGAKGPSYTLPAATLEDNGAQFACQVRTVITIQSRSAMLMVSGALPQAALSTPPALVVMPSKSYANSMTFFFPTEVGFQYYLQLAGDPSRDQWLNLSAPIVGDGEIAEVEVTTGNLESAMFRVFIIHNVQTGGQP